MIIQLYWIPPERESWHGTETHSQHAALMASAADLVMASLSLWIVNFASQTAEHPRLLCFPSSFSLFSIGFLLSHFLLTFAATCSLKIFFKCLHAYVKKNVNVVAIKD